MFGPQQSFLHRERLFEPAPRGRVVAQLVADRAEIVVGGAGQRIVARAEPLARAEQGGEFAPGFGIAPFSAMARGDLLGRAVGAFQVWRSLRQALRACLRQQTVGGVVLPQPALGEGDCILAHHNVGVGSVDLRRLAHQHIGSAVPAQSRVHLRQRRHQVRTHQWLAFEVGRRGDLGNAAIDHLAHRRIASARVGRVGADEQLAQEASGSRHGLRLPPCLVARDDRRDRQRRHHRGKDRQRGGGSGELAPPPCLIALAQTSDSTPSRPATSFRRASPRRSCPGRMSAASGSAGCSSPGCGSSSAGGKQPRWPGASAGSPSTGWRNWAAPTGRGTAVPAGVKGRAPD